MQNRLKHFVSFLSQECGMHSTFGLVCVCLFISLTGILCVGDTLNAQEAKISDKRSAPLNPPDLVIIPVPAQDKGAAPSHSRFVVLKKEGKLVANGVQDMNLKIKDFTTAQMGMEPNHWGLGAEHAFQIDFVNWGNGRFSADIGTDTNFPITFKVTDTGYAYLSGRGIIKVKDGKEYKLGYDINEQNWIAGIRSTYQLVREGSCEAAGRLGLTAAIPSLIAALKDSAWEVRRNACEALGLLGAAHAISPLEEAVADKDISVSKAATQALKQIREGAPTDAAVGGFMYRTTTETQPAAQMSIEQRAKLADAPYKTKGYLVANIITIEEGQEDAIIGRQDNGDYFKATAQGWNVLTQNDLSSPRWPPKLPQ